MINTSNLREDQIVRAVAYRWLSRMFAEEMDADTLRSAQSGDIRQFLDEVACDADLANAIRLFEFNVDRYDDLDASVMDLKVAFASLFLGAGGKNTAPPYASYYLTGRSSLHHDCVLEIGKEYERHGLARIGEFAEPPDHLALMLSYLSRLAEDGAEDGEISDFIRNHLEPWLPGFTADCAAHDPDGFYTAGAAFLRSFIQHDLRTLN